MKCSWEGFMVKKMLVGLIIFEQISLTEPTNLKPVNLIN
jgi:hypothetical protein